MNKLNLFVLIVLMAGAAIAVRELFPKTNTITNVVPQIVTQYDTVEVYISPDTIEVVTTDTVNIILRETFFDTTLINVACDPEERPEIYPVLTLRMGENFGDTSIVETFSLRTGKPTRSILYTPGFLTSLDITNEPTPRMNFTAFPKPRVSLWNKLKYSLIGFAGCEATHLFRN